MSKYQIITDATSDLTASDLVGYQNLEIVPMPVTVGDDEYTFGPGGNILTSEFYSMLKSGKFGTTSQINPVVYTEVFEKYLSKGIDVLYLCFSSGLSGTINTARMCISELQEKYPERKIVLIDTLCAAVGEGFLVLEALRKQSEGLSMDEMIQWVEDNKLKVCHWFTVDTFEHLRHGGRVSSAAAIMGTVFNIKPLLQVSNTGHLVVVEKPSGRKMAMRSQLKRMEKGWLSELSNLVVIGHGDNLDGANQLKQEVLTRFPNADVRIMEIGPVIGSHTGPGMLALVFWGTERN